MGFKNSNTVWTEVDAAGSSKMIPAGGYVARITDVEDVASKEYLRFTYDIAEGEHKGFFESDDRVYTHQFVRSYKETAKGFMKKFLDCVDESNDNFTLNGWNNDERDLVGKLVGIIVQREDYTNNDGDDRARMNVEDFAKVSDIRAGRFVLPEPKDNRKEHADSGQASASTPDVTSSVYDADIPF